MSYEELLAENNKLKDKTQQLEEEKVEFQMLKNFKKN